MAAKLLLRPDNALDIVLAGTLLTAFGTVALDPEKKGSCSHQRVLAAYRLLDSTSSFDTTILPVNNIGSWQMKATALPVVSGVFAVE